MGAAMALHPTLDAMKSARRWLLWRPNDEGGKVPYYVNGKHRSGPLDGIEDNKQLAAYTDAIAALNGSMAGQRYGLGFALGPDDNGGCWQGVDLDEVSTNSLENIANNLPGYVELSPSGQGAHAIGYGSKFNNLGSNGSGIEAYSTGRYFTFTGKVIRDGELSDLSPFVSSTLCPRRNYKPARQITVSQSGQPRLDVDVSTVGDIRDALTFIDANPYDIWLRILLALKTIDEPGHELARTWSATSMKFNETEFEKKWASLNPERTSYKVIFTEAARNGWRNPGYSQDVPLVDFRPLLKSMGEKLGFLNRRTMSLSFSPISTVEWEYSRLHPDSIIDNYLYADVGILIAPGGVGKTTLVIYEAICISLGIPLYGRTIGKPGKVLLLSAEDSREQTIARLAKIAESMKLFPEQIEYISNNILIDYVGEEDFRLCKVVGDVVTNSPHVDRLIDAIRPLNPSLLVIDPAVSFGVGESRVNDAEQGLIQAARRIRDTVGCCVRLVHHTGKQNARGKTTDQYSGRGGSAMADGARMVAVLQRMNADEWFKDTGELLPDNATGLLLALPKMSYAPAQPNIFIERIGFKYRHVAPTILTAEDKRAVIDTQVIEFLHSEEVQGRYHSKSSLEQCETLGITRNEKRAVIARLEVSGRIVIAKKPGAGQGQCIKLVDYSPGPMASNRQFTDQ